MDISTAGSLSSSLAQMRTGDAVGIAVLKKAMEIQAAGALQLLAAIPQVSSNPGHLGTQIDVKV